MRSRDAQLPQADVSASWKSGSGASTQNHWRIDAKTDPNGSFALCGLTTAVPTRISVTGDSAYMTAIDVTMTDRTRVVHRDLMLLPRDGDIVRGTVTGVVTVNGKPANDVRVLADWTDEAVTGPDGRFKVVGVPVGTRQIFAVPLGMPPASVAVDVDKDTLRVAIDLGTRDSSAAVLARANLASGFAARRKGGVGYFLDSLQLSRASTFFVALADIPDGMVQTRSDGIRVDLPECMNVPMWIDGAPAPTDVFMKIRPPELAGVEIYKRYETPAELRAYGINIAPRKCAIVMWLTRK